MLIKTVYFIRKVWHVVKWCTQLLLLSQFRLFCSLHKICPDTFNWFLDRKMFYQTILIFSWAYFSCNLTEFRMELNTSQLLRQTKMMLFEFFFIWDWYSGIPVPILFLLLGPYRLQCIFLRHYWLTAAPNVVYRHWPNSRSFWDKRYHNSHRAWGVVKPVIPYLGIPLR